MEQLYWASCANGLQFCLRSELEAIHGTHIVSDPTPNGGLLFRTTSEPQELAKLRSADNVYAFLGHYKDVPLDKEAGLKYLTSLPSKIDWEGSMALYRRWQNLYGSEKSPGLRPFVDREKENDSDPEISFRVTGERICLKMKKQGYTSMEAAAAIGEGVHDLLGWKANMRSYNVEVLAWIKDMELLLVLVLLYSGPRNAKEGLPGSVGSQQEAVPEDSSFHSKGSVPDEATKVTPIRVPKPSRSEAQLYSRRQYWKALVGTSLKPSTAFALLQLAQIAPGHIVIDPMCGCGTIPLEAADWLKGQLMCVAGDVSLQAVDAANTNAGLGAGGPCDVLQWDAANLPLRSGTVDRVICDMPFGNRCGNAKVREWLCPKVVKEVVRILQPGSGIAVLMAQSKSMRREVEVTQKPFLELLQQLNINMEGLLVDVYVLQRTMEPPPIQVFYPSKKNRKRSRTASHSISVGDISK